MKVKLISATQDPYRVMATAARTCYSKLSPIDIFDTEVNNEFVNKVLHSGHLSIAEHVNFTFAIEGISRACSHQLVRHRHCTFSQQSQRYVSYEEVEFVGVPITSNIHTDKVLKNVMDTYHWLINEGVPPEDARAILPNCTPTNIVVTTNLRNLIHICGLRLCSRSQREIRQLFKLIVEQVKEYNEDVANLLQVQCEQLGYCPEEKCCGRKVKKSELS